MGINEDVIYVQTCANGTAKRISGRTVRRDKRARREGEKERERLFAANTRTYYPLIIPRREITTLSRENVRGTKGNNPSLRQFRNSTGRDRIPVVSRAKRIPLLVHVWGCIDGDSFRFKPRSCLIPSGAENDPR